ncbi:MAG: L-seryl-tRNA(Sec) selenium transferase [Actinomycetota bacterium]
MPDPRRSIPSVDAILRSAPAKRAAARFGRSVVRRAVQVVLDGARSGARRAPPEEEVLLATSVRLAATMSYGLTRVINATGVVLHTNLGRASMPEEAARAAARAATSATDLEVDRGTGKRGRRTSRAEFLLTAMTGAEDALVVNNNAAALLLALAALARRREVLVSRGELIEIGGEFRLPDILAASGAKLVEVGTTNRTRVQDYRAGLTDRTALVLKVHPSNYRVTGFAEAPGTESLARLSRTSGIPLLYDLGSGLLEPHRGIPSDEPATTEALHQGADLVCFSGDKLLGGPQAGVVLGRRDLVERLRKHPIARAVRVDKMTVAALEVVLGMYARGERKRLPVWRALEERPGVLRARALALAERFPGAKAIRSEAVAGGGSLPSYGVPSHAVRLEHEDAEAVAARLRVGNPPVFCRVEDRTLLFDLRTVEPQDDDRMARAVRYALSQG